jgi:non-homologous end joining protein Ku
MAQRKMKIEFGLINLDCRRESAATSTVELKNLCTGQEGKDAHGPMPLKQDPSYCTACGVVDKDRIVKGHGSGSSWTVLTAEAVAALSEQKVEFGEHVSLKIVAHPAGEFLGATETGEGVYYVTPEPVDINHYALLTKLIEKHPELAFTGLLSLSTGRAKLWLLRVREGVLVLEERVREQSMKPTPTVEGEVNEKLLAMVEGSLEHFIAPYDAEEYEDRYETAVLGAIGAGQTIEGEGATVVAKATDDDLMAKFAALGGK